MRQGLPEVVYGPGKSPEQIAIIVRTLRDSGQNVLVTRVDADVAERVQAVESSASYDPVARLLWFGPEEVAIVATVHSKQQERPPEGSASLTTSNSPVPLKNLLSLFV